MIIAIDTNILFDILLKDPIHVEKSKDLLDEAVNSGRLIICETVFAELASQFPSQSSLQEFLIDSRIQLQSSEEKSLWIASQAWKLYTEKRGKQFQCGECGTSTTLHCHCGTKISARQHIITDFLIGAHAQIQANTLLTRDRGFYKKYFPDLSLNHIKELTKTSRLPGYGQNI